MRTDVRSGSLFLRIHYAHCRPSASTGARKDPSILCWDLRTFSLVYKLSRSSHNTNQRIFFAIEPCGQHLVSGGEDGQIAVFDISRGELARTYGPLSSDVVAAVDINPRLPLLAVGSGQRRVGERDGGDADDMGTQCGLNRNCLALWEMPCQWRDLE